MIDGAPAVRNFTVGTDAGVPFATHLPILVDPARGPLGTLRGHVARANPHWRYLAAGRPTLVIFAGAHAYVSPSWYARVTRTEYDMEQQGFDMTIIGWQENPQAVA